MKSIASGNLLYNAGNSNLVLCDSLEGCDGVGRKAQEWGTYVHLWLIHVGVWQKPTHCKATISQLKINKFKKKEEKGKKRVNNAIPDAEKESRAVWC